MSDLVKQLEQLLISFSDGEWEHGLGITIENIDNPGWLIRIALNDTAHESLVVEPRIVQRSEHDWLDVRTELEGHDKILQCACGPRNLSEALTTLLGLLGQPK